MRLQHCHLGVEGGLDLGELDLSLGLDQEMDLVALSLLLLELRLMRCERGVELRSASLRQGSNGRSKPSYDNGGLNIQKQICACVKTDDMLTSFNAGFIRIQKFLGRNQTMLLRI